MWVAPYDSVRVGAFMGLRTAFMLTRHIPDDACVSFPTQGSFAVQCVPVCSVWPRLRLAQCAWSHSCDCASLQTWRVLLNKSFRAPSPSQCHVCPILDAMCAPVQCGGGIYGSVREGTFIGLRMVSEVE